MVFISRRSGGQKRRLKVSGRRRGRYSVHYKLAWTVFLGLRSKESRLSGEKSRESKERECVCVCVTLVPGKAEGCRINRLHA